MITETGKLKVGACVDGKTHFDFELRGRLVRDSVDALEDDRARTNPAYEGLVMTAKQIIKLGDLSAEKITPDLLMSLNDIDMQEIMGAATRLQVRLANFRDGVEESAQAATGVNEGGLRVV